jgi:hypothetical protein
MTLMMSRLLSGRSTKYNYYILICKKSMKSQCNSDYLQLSNREDENALNSRVTGILVRCLFGQTTEMICMYFDMTEM